MPIQPVSTHFYSLIPQAYLVPISPQFHVTPANIAYSCLGGFTVVVRPFQTFLQAQLGGAHQDPAVWHVQLAYQREGNNYHTLGSPAIAQSFAAVHRTSHLGVPLRDHHWYAIKRGDRAIAHVVSSSTRPIWSTHILTP